MTGGSCWLSVVFTQEEEYNMLFDTHAHYDDEWFDADRDALLSSMPENGVGLIVNPGCDVSSSRTAVELANRYPHVYAAVGIHPENALGWSIEDVEEIERLARQEKKVVAIGEIGLDYYWLKRSPETTPSREEQKAVLRAQMAVAERLDLPVIIHDRDAHADCLEIVREFPDVRGVFHCFSGSYETAQELLKLGWLLSFTGSITYGGKKAKRIIQSLPEDRFMIETDSPYMTPDVYKIKGERVRNSSQFVHAVADKIAEMREMPRENVERLTWENGKRFFGIA